MKHNAARTVAKPLMLTTGLAVLALVPGCTWMNKVASDWPPQNDDQRVNAQQEPRQAPTRSADSPGAMTESQREYRYTRMPEQPDRQQQNRRAGRNMAAPQGLRVDQSRRDGETGRQANASDNRQLRQRLSRIEQQLTMLRQDFADIKPVMRKVQAAEDQIHQLSRELSQIDGAGGAQSGARMARSGDQSGQSERMRQQRNAGGPPVTWRDQQRERARKQARQALDMRRKSEQGSDKASRAQDNQDPRTRRQQSRARDGDNTQKQTGSAYVKGLRTGTFKGDTRLVLDLSQPADFSYDLDNQEGILIVEIDGAAWQASQAQDMPDTGLINSISGSTTRQGGSRMVVELSGDVDVVRAKALPPTGNNGHRIFMDLAEK